MAGLLDLNLGNPTAGGASPIAIALLPTQSAVTGDLNLGGLGGVSIGGATTSPPTNLVDVYVQAGGLAGVSTGDGGATPALQINLLDGLQSNTGLGGGVSTGGVDLGLGGTSTGGGATGGGTTTTTTTGGGTTGGGTTGGGTTTGGGAAGGLPDAVTAFTHIFRLADASEIPSATLAQLHQLQGMVDAGDITQLQATMRIANAAAGFTAVAETSYAFFSGLTPTGGGLDYLVHSQGNPADLSDSYYAPFNLENRYINFAANLGLHSDYAPQFAQLFGSMTVDQTVRTAYDRIIGVNEAAAAGINPEAAIQDIESRWSYFQQVAQERFGPADQNLAAKLAAVAYILEESVKANVGHYGEANQNFLVDLADGNAQFHIDLVGTYGHGTVYDVA